MEKLNKVLALLFSIITVILCIFNNKLSILLFLIYIFLPFLFKIKPLYTFIYLVFGFLSLLLGFFIHLYKTVFWYDSLVHFIWGIVSGILAIITLKLLKMYNNKNLVFNVLFIIIFSLAASCLWEIIEFIIDTIFKSDMQRRQTGVYDTMKDVIVALLGNILFTIWYFYEYKFNRKLIIRKYVVEEDL